MLRLSLRTLFSLTPSRSLSPYSILLTPSRSLPPYSILIAQCSTSSPPHFTHPHSHSDPDPRNVRVSVWWDLHNCKVPSGVNVYGGADAIIAAIESSGIKGPIQITAFVDILRLARTNQEALSSPGSTAIYFSHIPQGDKYIAHSCLCLELRFWVQQNPPPVHLFLITDFGGDASFLHNLRMKDYNILLASKESAPADICRAATIMWNWDALVRGENLSGRYFNQPPNEFWYGHYEGPLEEIPAFAPDDQPPDDQPDEVPEVFSQDSFWIDVQTFINTDLGSLIIAESRTREKMAYYLHKHGPSVLESVTKSDVLLLVDMLILEKKWVRESPHHRRPFKLTSANSDCTDSDYEFADSDDFSDSE